jgi:hypothetical protein
MQRGGSSLRLGHGIGEGDLAAGDIAPGITPQVEK